jgi:hypothetical protein
MFGFLEHGEGWVSDERWGLNISCEDVGVIILWSFVASPRVLGVIM